jgi:predicted CoA-binding protein
MGQIMTLKTQAGRFLAEKRIAVIGVSSTQDDAANMIYRKLRDTGHDVFAVNPKTNSVEGDTCYPSVKAIPGGVEAAVIVTRPEVTAQVVRECADAGVQQVWMHQGMGNSISEEAVVFCRENGIAVIPGACPMMYCEPVDFGHKCMRWMFGLVGRLPKE